MLRFMHFPNEAALQSLRPVLKFLHRYSDGSNGILNDIVPSIIRRYGQSSHCNFDCPKDKQILEPK